MPQELTTLILGAGASSAYGFPLGSDLRERILRLSEDAEARELIGRYVDPSELINFVDHFRESQRYSIDAFLARRPEYSRVGKLAIALVLLRCEGECLLFENRDDHWYQYLANLLTVPSWEDFDPSWLSIVTFNYDRSLETFLTRSIAATYGQTIDAVLTKLGLMRMVHFYGSFGDPFQKQNTVPFGKISVSSLGFYVNIASASLNIIPEGRVDGDHVVGARALIKASRRICFLGFGFDETNMRLLGGHESFMDGHSGKFVVATTLGMTHAERMRAAGLVAHSVDGMTINSCYLPQRCLELLRETLVIG